MLMLNVPATVGLMVLAAPIVRVIFEHGEFTPARHARHRRSAAVLRDRPGRLLGRPHRVADVLCARREPDAGDRQRRHGARQRGAQHHARPGDGLPRPRARHVDRRALQRRRCCSCCCAASLGGLNEGAAGRLIRAHHRRLGARWARRPCRVDRGCRRVLPGGALALADRPARRRHRRRAGGARRWRRGCCASGSSTRACALVLREVRGGAR